MRIRFIKRNSNNNKVILYCRIIVNSVRAKTDFSTNIKINEDQWDSKNQTIIGNKEATKDLSNFIEDIKDIQIELKNKGISYTAELIKAEFKKKESKEKDKIPTFKEFRLEYIKYKESDNVAKSTVRKYKRMSLIIQDCLKRERLENIYISDLTYSIFYNCRKQAQKKYNNSYTNKIFSLARTMMSFAKKSGYVLHNPISDFDRLKQDRPTITFLTTEEVSRIYNKDFGSETLNNVRDAFVFMCCTGLSYKDAKNFNWEESKIEIEGVIYISTSRGKSGIEVDFPLSNTAMKIMKKHNFQLKVISNPQFNKKLKK